MSFEEKFSSDHQCLWINIPFLAAYGHHLPPIAPPPTHWLHTSDLHLVAKYNQRLQTKVEQQDHILIELQDIQLLADQSGWNRSLETRFNEIHQRMQDHQLQVESKLCKLRTGKVPWSPALQSQ